MNHMTARTWMILTLVVGVAGIVISNFVGGSGSPSGEGSSLPSKVLFSSGALSVLVSLGLVTVNLARRLTSRT